MKPTVFIFHGTAGYPEENWFPWLKAKLVEKGLEVFVPQFPTPEGQSLKAWLKILEPYQNNIDQNTILIGHSLGGIFTLKLLEKLEHPVKAAVFVGTPIGLYPIKNYDRDSAFAGFEFDWRTIKKNAGHFFVYQSDNDPYVGLDNGTQLAQHLGTGLILIPNAGHFNQAAGYTQFEDLYQKLLPIL